MKKLITILFILISTFSFSQAVINRAGPANTVSDARGMWQYNHYLPRYPDTISANSPTNIGIDTCGAVIFTYAQGLCVRFCSPKRWVVIGSGGGGGVIAAANGLYLSGTTVKMGVNPLDANTQIGGGSHSFTFDDLSGFDMNVNAGGGIAFNPTDGATLSLKDTIRSAKRISYPINLHSTFTRYTLVDKAWVDSLLTGFPTPTWQQTLTASSTLNTSNTVSIGTNSFIIQNNTGEVLTLGTALTQLSSPDGSKTFVLNNAAGGVSLTIGSDATGDMYYRNSGGLFTRLPIGTVRQKLGVVGGIPAWIDTTSGTGGTLTGFTTFGSTPNANGGSVSGANIILQPADGTNPGGVSTTTQTFAGVKTLTTPSFTTGFTIGGAAASGKFIVGNGTNYVASTSTIPTSAGATALKWLRSDGTNYILSTSTLAEGGVTSGKILKSDGTNWVASTETYAVPGTSGNVLTSNGTNWTSTAPATSGTVTSIATTSPITGGTITSTGTIACATCVVATVNPGVGIAHFAGSTQTTTSSLIVNADITNSTIDLTSKVTGTLPIANGGTNNGSLSVTAGTLYYGDGTKLIGLAPGTTKQHLTGGTTPAWKDTATAVLPSSDTVYILATGQSNTSGFNSGNYDTARNTKVQGWNGSAWVTLQRAVAPMGWCTPGVFNSAGCGGSAITDSATGSFFHFAKRLQERTRKTVRVVSVPYAGNSILNWIPAASTNFTQILTYMTAIGNPHIDYMIWDQGEADNLADTIYKRKLDTLVQQLDAQSFFGKDVPILIVSTRDTVIFNQILNTQYAIGSGQFDKRYTTIDAANEPYYSPSPIHFSAQGQYNIANKMIQIIYNKLSMPNAFMKRTAAQRANMATYIPNYYKNIIVQDSTSQATYIQEQPIMQTGIFNGQLTLQQTNDNYGASSILVKNSGSDLGALIKNSALDVVGWTFNPNSNANSSIFFEHRAGQVLSGNTAGEFQLYTSGKYVAFGQVEAGIQAKLYLGSSSISPDSGLVVQNGIWGKRGLRLSTLPTFADTTNFKPLVINTTGTAGTAGTVYKATYWPGGGGGGSFWPLGSNASLTGNVTMRTVGNTLFLNNDGSDIIGIGDVTNHANGNVLTMAADGTTNISNSDFTGKLGINTASPSVALDVVGQIRVDAGSLGNNINGSGSTSFGHTSGSTYIEIDGASAGDFIAYNSASTHLFQSGTVQINDLAGTGTRAVLADATGMLSAPISDRSIKEKINPIETGIATLMKLKPVSFFYKKDWQNKGTGVQLGFIAQDIRDVIPSIVGYNPPTGKPGDPKDGKGKLGYDEMSLIPILVAAVQQQQSMIKDLQQQISKLKRKQK